MTTAPTHTRLAPNRLDWLAEELRSWQAAGLVEPAQADAILAGYSRGHRLPLVRLLLTTGAVFVGVGAIWLVAANLESLSPWARVGLVAAVWLTALVAGETLASRRAPAPVTGAVRLVAAMMVGAVVLQTAQTLQVPAYEPVLVGCWALAALVHAYAVGALTPLVIGVATGTGYALWATLADTPSGLSLVLTLAAVGLGALALAAVHDERTPAFAAAWRTSGTGLLLLSLVISAVPGIDLGEQGVPVGLLVGLGTVALVVLAGLLVGTPVARAELAGGVLVLGAGVSLVLWEVGSFAATDPTATDVVRAVSGLSACAAAAVGVAVVGTLRDSTTLVALATAALVVTTALQAFTVFAPVLEGAWLFLLLGALLVATGLAFDRGRRRLAEAL